MRYPIPSDQLSRLKELLSTPKTLKPIPIVFGHGLWNDLDVSTTALWLDTIFSAIAPLIPNHLPQHIASPRLFVTPSAAGPEKDDFTILKQGNKALMLFEEGVRVEVEKRGMELLGTWNMSIQARKYDGVHLDMKGNLVKAMMVLNWLDKLPINS